MFNVKATYNNETRKFTLKDDSFPSYSSIRNQLYRVFPIRDPYYLTELLFSPSEGTRVVVCREAHDEVQYNEAITPFSGRLWSNGLLRFTVVDKMSHKHTDSLTQLGQSHFPEIPTPKGLSRPLSRPHPALRDSMEVDSGSAAVHTSNRYSMASKSTQQSCCSLAEGKSEMKELMSDFLHDFSKIMSSTFGDAMDLTAESSHASTSAGEQKDLLSATDMVIPGAFFQPSLSSASTISADSLPHCNFCERGAGIAHQIAFTQKEDSRHSFAMAKPDNATSTLQPIAGFSVNARGDPVDVPPLIHAGIVCDFCNETIVGHRHKCLDCPDFDLCDYCFPRASFEHGQHEFVTIKEPGRVIIHEIRSRDEERPRAQRNRQYVQSARGSSTARAIEVVHQANCDLCDSRIRGTRYHPKHTFVRLEDTQDLSPCDPESFKKHNARCDSCSIAIRGIRYKCMHPECPDFDLCAKCEVMPIEVHPVTHPMLKMRSPDTVIPTVYRVGGADLILPAIRQPHATGIAVATEPEPERTDTSVYAEPETSYAAVSTSQASTIEPALVHCRTDPPLHSTSPLTFVTTFSESQPVVDQLLLTDHSSKLDEEGAEQMTQTPEVTPLILSFLANFGRYKDTVLRATFVSDVNIADGQIFPAGAEFVKSWRIQNNGEIAWPESTRVIFVAGDRMPAFDGAPSSYHIGEIGPGVTVDVYASDMKAPDIPGKYVGYWRLNDGTKPFGQSVWCDIMVSVQEGPTRLHKSLATSEVIMPEPSPTGPIVGDNLVRAETPEVEVSPTTPATPTMSMGVPLSDYDSTDSLLDEFETTSDDEFWEASREHVGVSGQTTDREYVVLYDNESTDDEDR
ncbi:hypothetical protein EW145_g4951 [Phellinidium pouzarii]|uniref:ZZ-type domain-containing protein n=1 Tax=Phellinidium pouzarii TaxID=167371 RepID=A0A4S4L1P4_9AGAM|nr:hypothetical protein EW145_g4951 [Phellinidium pouzarii]